MEAVGSPAVGTGSTDSDAVINHLPGDVLAIMFCYLDSKTLLIAAPAVCRQWRRLCAEMMPAVTLDVGWATVGGKWATNPLTDAGLKALARFRKVQGAHLAGCRQLTLGGIKQLAVDCPDLNHLDLGDCMQVRDAWIEPLAAGCPDLNHLNISLNRWGSKQVTDVGIERLAARCPNLNHLEAGGCKQVTDVGTA